MTDAWLMACTCTILSSSVAVCACAPPVSAEQLPLVCQITSEEAPNIQIRLVERTPVSLRGELYQNNGSLGIFQTGQTKGYGDAWWSFDDGSDYVRGKAVLFKDDLIWNPHQSLPQPSTTNRVLFVGLGSGLWFWNQSDGSSQYRTNRDLMKAVSGFWLISEQCLGGRMVRG